MPNEKGKGATVLERDSVLTACTTEFFLFSPLISLTEISTLREAATNGGSRLLLETKTRKMEARDHLPQRPAFYRSWVVEVRTRCSRAPLWWRLRRPFCRFRHLHSNPIARHWIGCQAFQRITIHYTSTSSCELQAEHDQLTPSNGSSVVFVAIGF